jgi:cytochrome c5
MLSKNIRMRAPIMALAATASLAMAMGGKPPADDAAVLERIAPVAKVDMVAPAGTAGKGTPRTGEQLFSTICFACHGPASAVPTSPKMGDKAAWAPRIGVGLDVLVKSATVGKNAMPPKGGSDATEQELTSAIVYMTNKSGASFKEPAAGAKAATNERNPEQIAQTVCFKCHETGEKGAPKLSDKAAWAQRGSKGLDAVTKTVIRGHGNMPARGGLADLTDQELKGLIAFMFKKVGSDIK